MSHTPQSSLPRGRALLVDEDAKDLKHFSTLLARMGYSVRAFMNYQEAEKCLEREHFDFVIVSQSSPAFETRHLVEFTLTRDEQTPVVVLPRCLEMNVYLCRSCQRTVSLLPEFALPYLRFGVSVVALFLIARLLEGRTLRAG